MEKLFKKPENKDEQKVFDWKPLQLQFKSFAGRLERSASKLISLKALVLLGILIWMQKQGIFQEYPAIDSFIGMAGDVTNWFYQIVMNIAEWLASLPMFQWIAELPF